ncbi:hypothetical protein DFH09DRAFT_1067804 [Mycena vulgaris]|nr:hypothetical protein DFH09DRAFT_1067804 [Mycena vulgaris]
MHRLGMGEDEDGDGNGDGNRNENDNETGNGNGGSGNAGLRVGSLVGSCARKGSCQVAGPRSSADTATDRERQRTEQGTKEETKEQATAGARSGAGASRNQAAAGLKMKFRRSTDARVGDIRSADGQRQDRDGKRTQKGRKCTGGPSCKGAAGRPPRDEAEVTFSRELEIVQCGLLWETRAGERFHAGPGKTPPSSSRIAGTRHTRGAIPSSDG